MQHTYLLLAMATNECNLRENQMKKQKVMRYCFFLISLLCANAIFSQELNYINAYHKNILEAEEYILLEKFDSALVCYKKAFKQVPYVFCYDYVNAAYIAHKAGNNNIARVYLDSAVVRGVYVGKFNIRKFKVYFDDKSDWKSFKTKKYYELKSIGQSRRNNKMIEIVDSLYNKDQKYRTLATKSTKNVSYTMFRENDSLVAIHLKKLLQSGKLTENSVGFACFGKIGTIVVHFLLEDEPFMYECYKKGIFEKRNYWYAICRKSLQFGKESKYITLTKNPKLINKANYLRHIDGIISLEKEDALKKIENKSNGLFFTL